MFPPLAFPGDGRKRLDLNLCSKLAIVRSTSYRWWLNLFYLASRAFHSYSRAKQIVDWTIREDDVVNGATALVKGGQSKLPVFPKDDQDIGNSYLIR
jgi:hypothetical protein